MHLIWLAFLRITDGYDEPEMLVKIIQQRLPHEEKSFNPKTLEIELVGGANLNTLDEVFEKMVDSEKPSLRVNQSYTTKTQS